MEKNIAVIWGDCSSPEIVEQTLRVLDKVAEEVRPYLPLHRCRHGRRGH